MHGLITHALALALDPKDPPKEIRLFKAGLNQSLKGPVLFDEKAGRDVMAAWKAMGHSLTIDYDHGSIRKDAIDPSKSGKSAGRFDLELRDGELWAVNIRWAPEAEAAIRREEWPFISPAFASDADGRPTLVLNFGLTGNPALLDPPRLIAASVVPFHEYPVDDAGAWDGAAAADELCRWASTDGSGDPAKIDWGKYAQGYAWQAKPGANGPVLGDFKLPHHRVVGGRLVTSKAGTQAAAAALQGARGQSPDIPPSDLPGVRHHIEQHYAQWGEKAPWVKPENTTMKWNALNDYMKQMGIMKPAMASALGMSVEALDGLMGGDGAMTPEQEAMMKKCQPGTMMSASDVVQLSALSVLAGRPGAQRDDVLARVGELQSSSVQLLSATSCTTIPSALARVAQLSALPADIVKLSGATDEADAVAKVKGLCAMSVTIEAQAKKAKEERVDGALNAARAANKIIPAEIDGPKGLRAMGLVDPEWLEEHLKHRTPIATLSAGDIAERQVDIGVTVTGALAGLVEKDGIVALNGVPYEKLGGDVKHNLAVGSAAEKSAFKALRTNWQKRGEPTPAVA